MKTTLMIGILCSISVSFAQSIQSNPNLEHDFSKTSLSAKHIDAFEFRAQQKVRDFCNYIQLVSDKSYDERLRRHSKKTALTLFNSKTCTLLDSIISGAQNAVSVDSYFNALLNTNYQRIIGEAKDIVLSENLEVTATGDYLGMITFTQSLKCFNELDQLVESIEEEKKVMVMLSRKSKDFGDAEKIIWVVELCDIQMN